jgi:flagellar hook-associated protein 2
MASADIIGALGAGSGVDVKALAQSLVDVEKMPREEAINTKIDDQERRIGGYSALMLALDSVKTAFQKLNDATDFNSTTIANNQTSALTLTATSSVTPDNHTIEVTQLAAPQRNASGGYSTKSESLNGSAAFSLQLTMDGEELSSIRVSEDTPQGIVDAINDADQGVSAKIIDTGDATTPYKIVLTGPTGSDGVFSYSVDDATGSGREDTLTFQAATADGTITLGGVSVDVTAGQTAAEVAEAARVALAASDFVTGVTGRSVSLGATEGTLTFQWAASDGASPAFDSDDTEATGATVTRAESQAFVAGASIAAINLADSTLTVAQDAQLTVDGLTISRSTNSVDDVITGVTLDLIATNTGSPADIRITRDTETVKDNLYALVQSYNDAMSDFSILGGERSEDETDIYSGSLRGDSMLRLIKTKLRAMFTDDSSTPGTSITAFRDIGLDIDVDGVMSLDETTLDDALINNYDDIVTIFSADTNSQTEYGSASRGIAGDAIYEIKDLISARGTILTQSESAQTLIDNYAEKLEELNTRMEALLLRYTKQFGQMESIVGQSNSLRDSLTATFDGMMAMYTKK